MRGGNVQLDSAVGLRIWRASGSEEWQVGIDEVSEHLETLGIPHDIAIVRRTIRRRRVAGFEAQVAWADLDTVLKWVPSLQKLIDAVEAAKLAPAT